MEAWKLRHLVWVWIPLRAENCVNFNEHGQAFFRKKNITQTTDKLYYYCGLLNFVVVAKAVTTEGAYRSEVESTLAHRSLSHITSLSDLDFEESFGYEKRDPQDGYHLCSQLTTNANFESVLSIIHLYQLLKE